MKHTRVSFKIDRLEKKRINKGIHQSNDPLKIGDLL